MSRFPMSGLPTARVLAIIAAIPGAAFALPACGRPELSDPSGNAGEVRAIPIRQGEPTRGASTSAGIASGPTGAFTVEGVERANERTRRGGGGGGGCGGGGGELPTLDIPLEIRPRNPQVPPDDPGLREEILRLATDGTPCEQFRQANEIAATRQSSRPLSNREAEDTEFACDGLSEPLQRCLAPEYLRQHYDECQSLWLRSLRDEGADARLRPGARAQ